MTAHRWEIPDGMWLADSPWVCATCQMAVKWWVDTRTVPPCPTRLWPWVRARRFWAQVGEAARSARGEVAQLLDRAASRAGVPAATGTGSGSCPDAGPTV